MQRSFPMTKVWWLDPHFLIINQCQILLEHIDQNTFCALYSSILFCLQANNYHLWTEIPQGIRRQQIFLQVWQHCIINGMPGYGRKHYLNINERHFTKHQHKFFLQNVSTSESASSEDPTWRLKRFAKKLVPVFGELSFR